MFQIIIHWIGTLRDNELTRRGIIIEDEFVSVFARNAFSLISVEVLLRRAVLT